jgi:alpha-D-ribose 1-methylphosphonate 5-triphosphate synthase subunit PhnG
MSAPIADGIELQRRRRAVMAVLVLSDAAEIAGHVDRIALLPRHEELRASECGLVMVRGRIGGEGAPFNLGEATVTRAAVKLESGERGFGYVLGRDPEKARLVALCDALVQTPGYCKAIEHNVVAPIRRRLDAACEHKAQQVAATKVEFFTLVRGED